MKTNTIKIGLLLACVTLLTCLVVAHLNAADTVASTQVKSAWQYGTFDFPPDGPTLDSNLNDLAKHGWEIISVSKYVDPNLGLQACVAVKIKIVPGKNSYKSGN